MASSPHLMPVRVYYEDTDFSGFVYHASYLRFLERGRTELLRAAGIDQQALHARDGSAFAVRQIRVDYLRPARMDDVLCIETRVAELRGPRLVLNQAIHRDGETLVTASVLVVCIKNARCVRIPDGVLQAFEGRVERPD